MTRWYISFASETEFLGATVVEAKDEGGALRRAWRLGINPGGEAAILRVPADKYGHPEVVRMLNRFCGKDEMLAHGGKRLGDCPQDVQDRFDQDFTRVCDDCQGGRKA